MLHIRIITPPGRTRLLLDRLCALPGIQNLVVLEGVAQRPEGDAVFFDAGQGAANPVFRAARGLGLDHGGPDRHDDGRAPVHRVDGPRGIIAAATASTFSAGLGVTRPAGTRPLLVGGDD
jgi:hypothetical protein